LGTTEIYQFHNSPWSEEEKENSCRNSSRLFLTQIGSINIVLVNTPKHSNSITRNDDTSLSNWDLGWSNPSRDIYSSRSKFSLSLDPYRRGVASTGCLQRTLPLAVSRMAASVVDLMVESFERELNSGGAPVRDHPAKIPPRSLEYILEQYSVTAGVVAVDLVVAGHHRTWLRKFDCVQPVVGFVACNV